MARRVFFSYHFQRDAWRANQVRNSWVTKSDRDAAGFFDAADQEEVQRYSDEAIKRWIDDQLQHTSVTAVLIGQETARREYVRYEIERSFERGNALVGIRIYGLKNRQGEVSLPGDDPLDEYLVETDSGWVRLSELFPTYDWKADDGHRKISAWIEEATLANRGVPMSWRENLVRTEEVGDGLIHGAIKAAAIGAGVGIGLGIVDVLSGDAERRRYK